MHKIPRDLSGRELARLLEKYGYRIRRETGSLIRLVSTLKDEEHKITIPDHITIKIGTLNRDLCITPVLSLRAKRSNLITH